MPYVCARVHLEHIHFTVLDGELHIHQADYAQLQCHGTRLLAHDILNIIGQRIGRQRASRITGVNASLFDMLHDGADHHLLAVANGVNIDFDCIIKEAIQQHR